MAKKARRKAHKKRKSIAKPARVVNRKARKARKVSGFKPSKPKKRRRIGSTMKVTSKKMMDTAVNGLKIGAGIYGAKIADGIVPIENAIGRNAAIGGVGLLIATFMDQRVGEAMFASAAVAVLTEATKGKGSPDNVATRIKGALGSRRRRSLGMGDVNRAIEYAAAQDGMGNITSDTLGNSGPIRQSEELL